MSKERSLDQMTRGLVAFGKAWSDAAEWYCKRIEIAFNPAADPCLDTLTVILDDAEMNTVREAIRANRIDPSWAVRIIGFGCPPEKLAEVDLLRQATGGDRESVERWVVEGRLDEALEALRAGRVGDMYEGQS